MHPSPHSWIPPFPFSLLTSRQPQVQGATFLPLLRLVPRDSSLGLALSSGLSFWGSRESRTRLGVAAGRAIQGGAGRSRALPGSLSPPTTSSISSFSFFLSFLYKPGRTDERGGQKSYCFEIQTLGSTPLPAGVRPGVRSPLSRCGLLPGPLGSLYCLRWRKGTLFHAHKHPPSSCFFLLFLP